MAALKSVPVLSRVAVHSNGSVVGREVFASAYFVEPYSSSGSVQFSLDVLVGECFVCLFGTCKFYVWMTVHL
jgi:hypothetical protein